MTPPPPPPNIHKIFMPKKVLFFLKTLQNIEIQDFEPKKWADPTYIWKYKSKPGFFL